MIILLLEIFISGVTTIGQGGLSPPRFSGVNITLIEGMASVQEFRRFASVSAPPLPNPSYAPVYSLGWSYMRDTIGKL